MTSRSTLVALAFAIGLVACAGSRKSAEAPSPAAPAEAPKSEAPAGQAAAPPPAPPSPLTDSASTSATATSPGAYAPPPNRSRAIAQASGELDISQRELDVSGGDCHNACRALGSMDRAAGRLCGLAQSTDEQRRCDDAKLRVYSARDKVRNTCGTCPDVSVDRSAPVPSH